MDHVMDFRGAPEWLSAFVNSTFYEKCKEHEKKDKTIFCTACCQVLCEECTFNHDHEQAKQLRVRRSSGVPSIWRSQISHLVNVDDIQIYIFNNKQVYYMKERPQKIQQGQFPCETCNRLLMDKNRFCSIQCKAFGVAKDPTLTFEKSHEKRKRKMSLKEENQELKGFEEEEPKKVMERPKRRCVPKEFGEFEVDMETPKRTSVQNHNKKKENFLAKWLKFIDEMLSVEK